MPCPLCGEERTREIFRWPRPKQRPPSGRPSESSYGRAGTIVRCVGCGLVRQSPYPSAPYEDAEDPAYEAEGRGLERTAERNLDVIERYRPPPGRLVDIGCGTGVLLNAANLRGWDVIGIEPSGWAAEVARRRGHHVVPSRLEDTDLQTGSVDVVVMTDVVEHLSDPLALLRKVRGWLRDGAVIFVCTPDVDSAIARVLRRWWWSVLPGHLLYFSRSTLSRVLQASGFDVAWMGTHPKTFSVGYYAGRLAGYGSGLGRFARRAAGAVLGAERLVTPDFRDRIAALALKR